MSTLFKMSSTPAPFRLSASLQDIFIHSAWERARNDCVAAMANSGRVLLCGAPGTGKTLLLQDLCATWRAQGGTVILPPYAEAEIDVGPDDILLVDEADRLAPAQLADLCRGPNPMVLAGLPALLERLAPGSIDIVTLHPLSPVDVARLVALRLAASGRPSGVFKPQAVAALARRSGGLFRLVVIIAGAALFFTEMRGADRVEASDVDEAATMRDAVAQETDLTPPVSAPELAPGLAPGLALEPQPAPSSQPIDWSLWPRRIVMAVVALVAAIGITVHLSDRGRAAAGEPAPPRIDPAPAKPVPLWPKHKLPPS